MTYRHGNTFAAHSQFKAAAANYDNESPYDEEGEDADEQLWADFYDAPDSIRAELMAEWIKSDRARDDAFFDFLRENRDRVEISDNVTSAVYLIRRAVPWLKIDGSASAMADFERAIELIRSAR